MGKFYFIFTCMALVMLVSSSGCNTTNPAAPLYGELYIDAESGFNNDSVIIKLDNKILANERLTTNYSISAAWLSGTLERPEGIHKLTIQIPGHGVNEVYSFKLEKILTVTFNYLESQKSILFNEYKGRIFRD